MAAGGSGTPGAAEAPRLRQGERIDLIMLVGEALAGFESNRNPGRKRIAASADDPEAKGDPKTTVVLSACPPA
ncbi:hypothetical protein NDU88_012606 [Pleurodeles waltl]|uniref:Uncharacterized protein n=1 Tax=Pleurodeles waltl TaxID=8319 RepID=A0AAV7R540_PLEWA|nr:hypothetical protein NDU88_012606 [Pleurodeles waltl]